MKTASFAVGVLLALLVLTNQNQLWFWLENLIDTNIRLVIGLVGSCFLIFVSIWFLFTQLFHRAK